MKINVTHVGKGWKPTPTSDPLYTLVADGVSEPIKTYDSALAVLGEHEAEEYTSKSGKPYWRIPKASTGSSGGNRAPQEKVFRADPQKMKQEFSLEVARNQSIQRQVAVKVAAELIVAGKREYDELYDTFGHIMTLLTEKDWQEAVHPDLPDDLVDEDGDPDLPPIDSYEGME